MKILHIPRFFAQKRCFRDSAKKWEILRFRAKKSAKFWRPRKTEVSSNDAMMIHKQRKHNTQVNLAFILHEK